MLSQQIHCRKNCGNPPALSRHRNTGPMTTETLKHQAEGCSDRIRRAHSREIFAPTPIFLGLGRENRILAFWKERPMPHVAQPSPRKNHPADRGRAAESASPAPPPFPATSFLPVSEPLVRPSCAPARKSNFLAIGEEMKRPCFLVRISVILRRAGNRLGSRPGRFSLGRRRAGEDNIRLIQIQE